MVVGRSGAEMEVFYRELAQRSCTESFFRDLVRRALGDLVRRALGDLVQRSWQEVSYRDLANRAFLESLYGDLVKTLSKRPIEILY